MIPYVRQEKIIEILEKGHFLKGESQKASTYLGNARKFKSLIREIKGE